MCNLDCTEPDELVYYRDLAESYKKRCAVLENERNTKAKEVTYYREQLAKAHELLGRVVHQTSERWDSVRLTPYYPTDNLHNKRSLDNPEGK